MKVMFVQLPHFFEGTSRPPTMYPLGISYLVSLLKKDHELVPMDLWIENSSVNTALSLIKKNVPDIFCVSVYSTQYPYFKELISALKAEFPAIKVIAGGPGATFSYSIFLERTLVDYCVIGEGEMTLKELLANLDCPEKVPGIVFRKNGSLFRTAPREQIKNLDTLPLPDREFFNIEQYISNRVRRGEPRSTNLIAGRGCPYQCTFCSKTFSGIRLRSIDKIEEEINYLKTKYKLDVVDFDDELVIVNKQRILQLCEMLKPCNIKWGCQGRINAVDVEILQAMKDAHCIYVGYGVESYSQKILDNMKKKVKVETIIPVIEMTKKVGIKPVIQYMYGFPGEDDDSINNTIELFKAIDTPYYGFTTTPIPGTELYSQTLAKGLIKDEEEYLLKLASGYNSAMPLLNLTNFSDDEFLAKRDKMIKVLSRIYFKNHPALYVKQIFVKYISFAKLLLFNPQKAIGKIGKRLSVFAK
ncbi:MAG: radical SAM protein [Elusimicrobia bacterium]|nr:radical SAM protein [Elusimicrobiota bacterium]